MLTVSIIGMSRRRWLAERPFEGHTKESLQRKLQSAAVSEQVKELIRQELERRSWDPLSN